MVNETVFRLYVYYAYDSAIIYITYDVTNIQCSNKCNYHIYNCAPMFTNPRPT
jgi:hypothetical protein